VKQKTVELSSTIGAPRKRFRKLIPTRRLPKQSEGLTVARVLEGVELIDRPVQPAHEQESDGKPMGDDENVVGEVTLGEVAVEGAEEVGGAIIYVGPTLSVREPIEEGTEGPRFALRLISFFARLEAPPLLFA